jgi:hypothetical protein
MLVKSGVSGDVTEKDDSLKNWGSIMPYAVNIVWWFWIHWSWDKVDWKLHSHWCVRTPTYYVKEIYDKVNEIQFRGDKVIINTLWIYNN